MVEYFEFLWAILDFLGLICSLICLFDLEENMNWSKIRERESGLIPTTYITGRIQIFVWGTTYALLLLVQVSVTNGNSHSKGATVMIDLRLIGYDILDNILKA